MQKTEIVSGQVRDEVSGKFVSKYDPSVGEDIVELSRKGFTLEAIAGYLGISRKTLFRWRQENPELEALCEVAQGMRQFAWEKTLIDAPSGPAVQAASMALRAMDMKNFNDRKQIDVNVETKQTIDLKNMSLEDLQALQSLVSKQEQLTITDAEYEEVPE